MKKIQEIYRILLRSTIFIYMIGISEGGENNRRLAEKFSNLRREIRTLFQETKYIPHQNESKQKIINNTAIKTQ